MTWTDGYITDVRYPAFFYKEMQPLWLSTVAALQGFAAPAAEGAFTLCELGCGVGVNLLVSAACHPEARFTGVDFNEDHLRLARDAAAQCGLDNIDFVHTDFTGFVQSCDAQFDFVTCHGVWSWVGTHHQDALLECASRGLKDDGLLYLHYMCHPGSTDLLPLQHLLNLCAHHMPGPSPRKVQTGMKLLQQLSDAGLFSDKPVMKQHLANMAKRDPADLAHEFITDNWLPHHSVDVHQCLGQSGLTFLGSADVFNNLDPSLSIPARLQGLIRQTRAPALAETLKDMARNAHQRMDVFQKRPTALSRDERLRIFCETRFQLLPGAPRPGPVTFTTPIGPIVGPEEIFKPLLQRLSATPASGAELLDFPAFSEDPGALFQSLQLLMMQQIAHPMGQLAERANERAGSMSRWFQANGIALTILPDCKTAMSLTG